MEIQSFMASQYGVQETIEVKRTSSMTLNEFQANFHPNSTANIDTTVLDEVSKKISTMTYEEAKQYKPQIDENNDAFLPNDPTSLSKIGQSNKSNTTSQESLFTTKNKLFSDFDKFKDYYENSKENWTSNINMNEIFKNMDEIKTLYTQKVEENNAILNSYTKNTKKQIF